MLSNTAKNKVNYNPFANHNPCMIPKYVPDETPFPHPENMVEASWLTPDKSGRLTAFMQKAEAGEPVTVLALGGSITEGSGASDGEYYIDNLARWFSKTYPNKPITCKNVGRGTTTSLFGSARVQRDLAPLNPDLVIVEYAVNDIILSDQIAAEAFEGLLRKLLDLPTRPAVMILFCCCGNFATAEPYEAKIAAHYGLPSNSFSAAMRFEMVRTLGQTAESMTAEESEKWLVENYVFDGCHPNTKGYYLLTDFIIHRLEEAKHGVVHSDTEALPSPLYSDRFASARICDNRHLQVVANDGWIASDRDTPYEEHGFLANQPGAEITFLIPDCKLITLVTRRSIKANAGVITYSVDGGEEKELDAFFANGWGTHNNYLVILDDQVRADRRLTLRFTGEKKPETLRLAAEQGLSEAQAGSKFILSEIEPA